MKKNGYLSALSGLTLFALLVVFSQDFIRGINSGLLNCAKIIIPSVFPFLIAASLAGEVYIPARLRKILNPVTQFLFRLPAESLPAVIIGLLGGYLSGVKAVQSLHTNGNLTNTQANRLMYFCVNAGMGFSVNAVGTAMLCSREAGRVIFASLCISSLIMGIFVRFIPDNTSAQPERKKSVTDFSSAVVNSVTSASYAMLSLCAFTVFFSGICATADTVIKNELLRDILLCLIEVTNGCMNLTGKVSLPVIAAVCAFGGVCVHLQIFSLARSFRLKTLYFFTFRIVHSALAFAVCRIIIHFHPIEAPVFLSFSENAAIFSFSAPASISLLFLCFLLISDLDNSRKIC